MNGDQHRNIPTPDVGIFPGLLNDADEMDSRPVSRGGRDYDSEFAKLSLQGGHKSCLLYTSPSPRDATLSRMPSSA